MSSVIITHTRLGPQTRWPEGCCGPIRVRQVSEYDSNPSEGRIHTNIHHSAFQTAPPPCAPGSGHTLHPPGSRCLLPQWRKHISRPGSGSSFSLLSFSPGSLRPSSSLSRPTPSPALLDNPPARPSSVCTMFSGTGGCRDRYLSCLPFWRGDP